MVLLEMYLCVKHHGRVGMDTEAELSPTRDWMHSLGYMSLQVLTIF